MLGPNCDTLILCLLLEAVKTQIRSWVFHWTIR